MQFLKRFYSTVFVSIFLFIYFVLRVEAFSFYNYDVIYRTIPSNPSPGEAVTVDIDVKEKQYGTALGSAYFAEIKVEDPHDGQSCITSDNSLKMDGHVSGICSSSLPGDLKIYLYLTGYDGGYVSIDSPKAPTFTIKVKDNEQQPVVIEESYQADAKAATNKEDKSTNNYCPDFVTLPEITSFHKQNDTTFDIYWKHGDPGVSDILIVYGTDPNNLDKERISGKNPVVIDNLDALQTYYFASRAVTSCRKSELTALTQLDPLNNVMKAYQKPSRSVTPVIENYPTPTHYPKHLVSGVDRVENQIIVSTETGTIHSNTEGKSFSLGKVWFSVKVFILSLFGEL